MKPRGFHSGSVGMIHGGQVTWNIGRLVEYSRYLIYAKLHMISTLLLVAFDRCFVIKCRVASLKFIGVNILFGEVPYLEHYMNLWHEII